MVKLFISVKPGSRNDSIRVLPDNKLKISIKAPPVDGKANTYLIKYLSKKTGIPKSLIHIKSGHNSKSKLLEIEVDESIWEKKGANLNSSE